jgi:hypothetical protein
MSAAKRTAAFHLRSYGETATCGSNMLGLDDASKTVTATRGEPDARCD